MKRSTDRILTTHTGSLPRPDDLLAMLQAREQGKEKDTPAFYAQAARAVEEVVRAQVEAGIDIVNDGEQGKVDYSTYIKDRLDGFEGETTQMAVSREALEFPEFSGNRGPIGMPFIKRPTCSGPLAWKDFAAVERDIAVLKIGRAHV